MTTLLAQLPRHTRHTSTSRQPLGPMEVDHEICPWQAVVDNAAVAAVVIRRQIVAIIPLPHVIV